MAAVQQQVRTETITAQKSVVLLRNLVRTTISSVCYLRNIFPEECFVDKDFAGLQIKSLKAVDGKESATLINWLEKGVFEALQKNYLDKIVFAITDSDPESPTVNVLEQYTFDVAYAHNLPPHINLREGEKHISTMNGKCDTSKEGVKKATISMLRAVITLTQTLSPLPEDRYLTMRLFYTDETPLDYQPNFFQDATNLPISANADESMFRCKLGEVGTPHHQLKLKLKSTCDEPAHQTGVGTFIDELQDAGDSSTNPTEHKAKTLLELMKDFVLSEKHASITTSEVHERFPSMTASEIKANLNKLTKEGFLKLSGTNKYSRTTENEHDMSQGQAQREAEEIKQDVLNYLATASYANPTNLSAMLGYSVKIIRPLITKLWKEGYLGKHVKGKGREVLECCRQQLGEKEEAQAESVHEMSEPRETQHESTFLEATSESPARTYKRKGESMGSIADSQSDPPSAKRRKQSRPLSNGVRA